ncbi:putative protein glutamine dumper [Helianthus anomalus]
MTPNAISLMAPSPVNAHPSPWHTPVPYLYGGVAVIFGVICVAILVISCCPNYNINADEGENNVELVERDPEAGDVEDKYLVIMAGQANPTFLATAVSISSGTCYEGGCRRVQDVTAVV